MNNNQNELSLGNFCRIVKELAQNKGFANQTEVFYTLFDVDDVSDSTINNYCIGYRAIGINFRQKYITYKKQFLNGENVFDDVIFGLISILDGMVYSKMNHDELLSKINNHLTFKKLVYALTEKRWYFIKRIACLSINLSFCLKDMVLFFRGKYFSVTSSNVP